MAGDENVGRWDLFWNISSCVTTLPPPPPATTTSHHHHE
jgi:hypothetical protein